MRLWKLLDADVAKNGTPPPCWKFLYATINGWNKCMGDVYTIRKTLGFHKTKRGSNTKLGLCYGVQRYNTCYIKHFGYICILR